MDKFLLNKIKHLLVAALPDLQAVYLFGSCATGEDVSTSDIDLAFLAQHLVPSKQCWDVAQQLAVSLGRDVDLIDLHQASTVMQKEIVSTGQRIIYQDVDVVENYETFVFSSYARLNEERRAILDDIRSRGSIYG